MGYGGALVVELEVVVVRELSGISVEVEPGHDVCCALGEVQGHVH